MSDYASIVERARRASATVSRLEMELTHAPESAALQINLAAATKMARRAHEQLVKLSEYQRKEVCDYRLLPSSTRGYSVSSVSKSLLGYQNLFSQIFDSKKNGKKSIASIGKDAMNKSGLEFAYTYSGSLGVILLAQS